MCREGTTQATRPGGTGHHKKTMTIKFLTTPDGFDPSALLTEEQYDESIDAYEQQLMNAILKEYPEADIEFYRSNDEYGSPSNDRGFEVSGTGEDDPCHIEDDIQRISELVFETGLFWATETESDLIHCQCGEVLGVACECDPFPKSNAVIVEHMPDEHRSSHEAAGNRGCYPHNGAIRILVHPECVEHIVDGDWTFAVKPGAEA